jgi:signal transduction histidine kinase
MVLNIAAQRHLRSRYLVLPAKVKLTVRDEGRGFDLKEVLKGNGLGLTSMRERMKLVGDDFAIDSRLQGGTTIRARVPVKPRLGAT